MLSLDFKFELTRGNKIELNANGLWSLLLMAILIGTVYSAAMWLLEMCIDCMC